ncbi:MAG: HAD family hydrolase [bacterium]
MLEIDIPGRDTIYLDNLLMDFNGTLAVDGYLIEGVAQKLRELSAQLNLMILTADTFGLVEESCKDLPVTIQKIAKGEEQAQKCDVLKRMGGSHTAAIGNGSNDCLMLQEAVLGICVMGGEGTSLKTFSSADICVPDIITALKLFLNPTRIIATLRV